MSQFTYLSLESLLLLIRKLNIGPVRDLGLLDAAVHRPRSNAFGHEFHGALDQKAGALVHCLANNLALVDGNKRLAWLATVTFPDLNGAAPDFSDAEAFDLVWEIADTDLDVAAIARRLIVTSSPSQ